MLSEYSRTKSESLAQISTAMAEIQNFLGDCFLVAHPVVANNPTVCENKGQYYFHTNNKHSIQSEE